MIRIKNIPLPLDSEPAQLPRKAARLLGIKPEAITEWTIARQAIDARKKANVHYVCTIDITTPNEAALARRAKSSAAGERTGVCSSGRYRGEPL